MQTDQARNTANQSAGQAITYKGKPCSRCAADLRYTSNRSCVACTAARRKARAKQHPEAERERVRVAVSKGRQHRRVVESFDCELASLLLREAVVRIDFESSLNEGMEGG